jgi:hypothetical protein
VYFDVTGWINNNDQQAKAALDTIIASQDKELMIFIPANEYAFLSSLLMLSKFQFSHEGLPEKDVELLDRRLADALEKIKTYKGQPPLPPLHVPVTMLLSQWSQILALLTFVQPDSLHSEERIETLKAIISGTMKSAKYK